MNPWKYLAKHAVVAGMFLVLGTLPGPAETMPWDLFGQQAREVFEKASPYVVGITVRAHHPPKQVVDPSLLPKDFKIRSVDASSQQAWEEYLYSASLPKETLATGLIIDRDGYILTTGSAIRDATTESASVTLADGQVLSATLMARDPFTNLAVLKVDRSFDNVAVFGRSRDVKIGSSVVGITRPYGRSNSLFLGTISNLGQELGQARYENLIQTSIPLHPGSIGSPILNFDGQVLGMLSTTQKQSSWPELSFAIPSDMLEYIAREIISHGSVTRGFLGVWVHPLTSKERQKHQIPSTLEGVRVTRLEPQGPAETAGLLEGDVITSFNENPVRSYQQLIWYTAVAPPEAEVPIRVWRQGQEAAFRVTLGRLSAAPEKP